MATKEFPLVPEEVPAVQTKYRTIATEIPVPESVPLLEKLRSLEPRSMGGQPPVIWHHGEGFTISDAYGNRWIDFSSGVLVTSCGHGHPAIKKAIADMANQGLYHTYCFASDVRLALVAEMTEWLVPPLKRIFLLTTGSEAAECCIKLAMTRGQAVGGVQKSIFVSFEYGFHGRTWASQLAGGSPPLKAWMGKLDKRFVQVPFPDGFRQKDQGFEVFEKTLKAKGVDPDKVCGVMAETFQGCNACLMPKPYAQALRKWCDAHQAVMIYDEIQSGFGRTGKAFGFQHCGVVPDLVACGKGVSGGMPLSAVLGTEELMNMYGPGEMTSTHSANPICCAAALASLSTIRKGKLVENAAKMAPLLKAGAGRIAKALGKKIGKWNATGLVTALQFTKPGTTTPEPDAAWEFVRRAVGRGVMLFAPVGVGGCAVKINPPLLINAEGLAEGLDVLETVAKEMA